MAEGEGYSREAYQQALIQKRASDMEMTDAQAGSLENRPFADQDRRRALLHAGEAEQRLQQLMESAHDEAIALNKEYDDRVREVDEAIRRLHEFEQEKLGMGKGEPDGQIIGAINTIGEKHEQK